MKIYEKLRKIQKELFVPKDNYNDFGKYAYRSCEDILKAVKPINEKYGVVLTLDSDMKFVGTGNYIEATAILTDIEDNEQIKVRAYAREPEEHKGMDDSQMSGSALSYCRKYALAGLYAIDNEKDSDATNTATKEEKPKEEKNSEAKVYEIPMDIKAYDLSEIKDDTVRGKKQFAMLMRLVESFGQDKEELGAWIQDQFGKKVMYLSVKEYLQVIEHVFNKNEPETFEYKDIPFGF